MQADLKVGTSIERRPYDLMTVAHFGIPVKYKGQKDWHKTKHAKRLVRDRAAYVLSMDIYKSRMRRCSG